MLGTLGSTHALVVHGNDGLDEITLGDETQVWEMKRGEVSSYVISPEELGFSRVKREVLQAGSVAESMRLLRVVLGGTPGPARDIVLMNSAAALVAADRATTLQEGVCLAAESIDNGRALEKLDAFVRLSNELE